MPQSKQPTRGKKAVTPKRRPSAEIDPKCNLPNICTFLDQLSPWLQLLNEDYTALRIAVCNVEKQAFSGTGVDARPPRFCSEADNAPAPPMRLR
jgi:hypothetical protein